MDSGNSNGDPWKWKVIDSVTLSIFLIDTILETIGFVLFYLSEPQPVTININKFYLKISITQTNRAALILLFFITWMSFITFTRRKYNSKKLFNEIIISPFSHFVSLITFLKTRHHHCYLSSTYDIICVVTEPDLQPLQVLFEELTHTTLQIITLYLCRETYCLLMVCLLLSITSVILKSMLFVQSIEIKTYMWTCLCIVADFIGFILIALKSDVYLLYLNTYCYWIYKILHGPFLVIGNISWSIIGFIFTNVYLLYFMVLGCFLISFRYLIYFEFNEKYLSKLITFMCNLKLMCLAVIFTIVTAELSVFTFFASILFASSNRWEKFETRKVYDQIHEIIKFISVENATSVWKNDREIRIMVVNDYFNFIKRCKFQNAESLAVLKHNPLKEINYTYIRGKCYQYTLDQYLKYCSDIWKYVKYFLSTDNPLFYTMRLILVCSVLCTPTVIFILYIMLVILSFFALKIIHLLFPYFIMYHVQWKETNFIHLLVLFLYIIMQITVFLSAINVFRIHWWLFHIKPGGFISRVGYDEATNRNNFNQKLNERYNRLFYPTQINSIIYEKFGDISEVIYGYIWNKPIRESDDPLYDPVLASTLVKGDCVTYDSDPECESINKHIHHGSVLYIDKVKQRVLIKDEDGTYGNYFFDKLLILQKIK